jgi:hypothetical protein
VGREHVNLLAGIRKPALGAHAISSLFGVLLFASSLSLASAAAQQVTGEPGFAQRHHHGRRKATPGAASAIWRSDQTERR